MAQGPYREGNLMVVEEGCGMPSRCPKCNADAAEEPMSVRFISRRGAGLQRVVVAIADHVRGWNYTGPVDVDMYFCPAHRARKSQYGIAFFAMIVVGGILFALTSGSASVPMDQVSPAEAGARLVGFILVAIGVMCGVMMMGGHFSPWHFTARHFNDRQVWVGGVSPAFLKALPTRAPAQPVKNAA